MLSALFLPALAMLGPYFSQVAVGERHACALRTSDSLVLCWGDNPVLSNGVQGPPNPNERFKAIAAGRHFNLGLTLNGSLQTWGQPPNSYGQPPGKNGAGNHLNYTDISTDGSSSCGIRAADGVAECYGSEIGVRAESPPGETFSKIAVADSKFICGLRQSNGTALCWGYPGWSYPTPSQPYTVNVATPPAPTVAFSAISAGGGTSMTSGYGIACALRVSDGTVVCWGGLNWAGVGYVPAWRVHESYRSINVGTQHTCAVKQDYSVRALQEGTGEELRTSAAAPFPPHLVQSAPSNPSRSNPMSAHTPYPIQSRQPSPALPRSPTRPPPRSCAAGALVPPIRTRAVVQP
jgi:hypothetical protein